jgi:ubiquitin carboxyl-terminal hydrolase 7
MQVMDDDTFRQYQGFDLAEHSAATFQVPETETLFSFKSLVAKKFGCARWQFRFWVVVNRQNKTVRPDTCISEDEPALSELIHINNFLITESETFWHSY